MGHPSLVLAVVLSLTLGFTRLWIGYWLFNVMGVWLYCDENGHDKLATQKWLNRLTSESARSSSGMTGPHTPT